jgi:hypothetical protein
MDAPPGSGERGDDVVATSDYYRKGSVPIEHSEIPEEFSARASLRNRRVLI